MNCRGNNSLLSQKKTAFLCSRRIPAPLVMKCYDWAIEQRTLGNCIISGFHSQFEKDVLHYLLQGKQPIIVALARGLKKRIEPQFQKPLDENRLLLVSPFPESIRRSSIETAIKRNRMMIEMSEQVFVAYAQSGGNVEREALRAIQVGKKVATFDSIENARLIEAGALTYSKPR